MSISAVCTYGATLWIKQQSMSVWLDIAFKWLSENGSFYAMLIACSRFIPKEERTENLDSDSLLQMVFVEGFDTALRCALFYVSSLFPDVEEDITAWGSLGLDVVFLILVEKSHNLIEISRALVTNLTRPVEILSLGL